MLKLICGFGNRAHLSDIEENIGRFYAGPLREDDFEMVYHQLGKLEEEGVVYETNGIYGVNTNCQPQIQEVLPHFKLILK